MFAQQTPKPMPYIHTVYAGSLSGGSTSLSSGTVGGSSGSIPGASEYTGVYNGCLSIGPNSSSSNHYLTIPSHSNGPFSHASCGGEGYVATGTSVLLYNPNGLAVDSLGNLYIAEQRNIVHRVTTDGIISSFAGGFSKGSGTGYTNGTCDYNGLVPGYGSGNTGDGCPANESNLGGSRGVAIAPLTITGTCQDIFGGTTSSHGGDCIMFNVGGGSGTQKPFSIKAGDIVYTDYTNKKVWRVDHTTYVTNTIVANNTGVDGALGGGSSSTGTNYSTGGVMQVGGMAFDNQGHLYLADFESSNSNSSQIRLLDFATNQIMTVANRTPGGNGYGVANSSWGYSTSALNASNANGGPYPNSGSGYYPTATGGACPSPGWLSSPGVTSANVPLGNVEDIAVDGHGNLYIPDSSCDVVYKVLANSEGFVDGTTGISIIAGQEGVFGSPHSNGYQPALSAVLNSPTGVRADYNGNLYIETGSVVYFYDEVTGYLHNIFGGATAGTGCPSRVTAWPWNGCPGPGYAVEASGTGAGTLDGTSTKNGTFMGPLAMDPWGNLYVEEQGGSSAGQTIGLVHQLALGTDADNASWSSSIEVHLSASTPVPGTGDAYESMSVTGGWGVTENNCAAGSLATGTSVADNTEDCLFTVSSTSSSAGDLQIVTNDYTTTLPLTNVVAGPGSNLLAQATAGDGGGYDADFGTGYLSSVLVPLRGSTYAPFCQTAPTSSVSTPALNTGQVQTISIVASNNGPACGGLELNGPGHYFTFTFSSVTSSGTLTWPQVVWSTVTGSQAGSYEPVAATVMSPIAQNTAITVQAGFMPLVVTYTPGSTVSTDGFAFTVTDNNVVTPITTMYDGPQVTSSIYGSSIIMEGLNSPLATISSAVAINAITCATPGATGASPTFKADSSQDAISLSGSVGNGCGNDTLTYQIVSGPAEPGSSVSIAGSTAYYTPASDWSGSDSFQFEACDSKAAPSQCSTAATVSITVTKLTPQLTLTCTSPVYYNSQQQGCNASAGGAIDPAPAPTSASFAYSYVGTALTGWNSANAPTDVDTYTVNAEFTTTDPAYYSSIAAPASSLVIQQAAVTATVTIAPATYSGSTVATISGCTLGGVYSADTTGSNSVTCNYGSATATFASADASSSPIAVTVTGLSLSGNRAGEYSLPSGASTTGTISAANTTVSVSCPPNAVYNGSAQPCSATASVGGNSISTSTANPTQWSWSNGASGSNSGNNQTDAGSYSMVATFLGTTDYNSAYNTTAYPFTIAAYTPSVSVTCNGATFLGVALNTSSSCSATVTGVSGVISGAQVSWSPASVADGGTYSVTATYAGSSPDYSSASNAATPASWVVSGMDCSATVGGSAVSSSVTVPFGQQIVFGCTLPANPANGTYTLGAPVLNQAPVSPATTVGSFPGKGNTTALNITEGSGSLTVTYPLILTTGSGAKKVVTTAGQWGPFTVQAVPNTITCTDNLTTTLSPTGPAMPLNFGAGQSQSINCTTNSMPIVPVPLLTSPNSSITTPATFTLGKKGVWPGVLAATEGSNTAFNLTVIQNDAAGNLVSSVSYPFTAVSNSISCSAYDSASVIAAPASAPGVAMTPGSVTSVPFGDKIYFTCSTSPVGDALVYTAAGSSLSYNPPPKKGQPGFYYVTEGSSTSTATVTEYDKAGVTGETIAANTYSFTAIDNGVNCTVSDNSAEAAALGNPNPTDVTAAVLSSTSAAPFQPLYDDVLTFTCTSTDGTTVITNPATVTGHIGTLAPPSKKTPNEWILSIGDGTGGLNWAFVTQDASGNPISQWPPSGSLYIAAQPVPLSITASDVTWTYPASTQKAPIYTITAGKLLGKKPSVANLGITYAVDLFNGTVNTNTAFDTVAGTSLLSENLPAGESWQFVPALGSTVSQYVATWTNGTLTYAPAWVPVQVKKGPTPTLSASPTSIPFGDLTYPLATPLPSSTITVTDNSGADVNWVPSGTDANYSVTPPSCETYRMLAGSPTTCVFTVTFQPTAAGAGTAETLVLTATDNANSANTQAYDVALTGYAYGGFTACGGGIASSTDCGVDLVTTDPYGANPGVVTITNTSGFAMTFPKALGTLGGGLTSAVKISAAPSGTLAACSSPLVNGASCAFTLTYTAPKTPPAQLTGTVTFNPTITPVGKAPIIPLTPVQLSVVEP
jgi:hypothetical protein